MTEMNQGQGVNGGPPTSRPPEESHWAVRAGVVAAAVAVALWNWDGSHRYAMGTINSLGGELEFPFHGPGSWSPRRLTDAQRLLLEGDTTRAARHGLLYTSEGTLTIKQARYREDDRPPDPACACPTCRASSRAYLRHLFVSGEPTAATLLTVHNLTSILDLMRRIRDALEKKAFGALAAETAERSRTDDRKDTR